MMQQPRLDCIKWVAVGGKAAKSIKQASKLLISVKKVNTVKILRWFIYI